MPGIALEKVHRHRSLNKRNRLDGAAALRKNDLHNCVVEI